MYEYFGVGPKIQEEVNDIFPRFLRWLPKHHLSMTSRCSLEIWRLVINNLTANYVSHFTFFFLWDLWCLMVVWSFSHFGFFGDFSDVFNPSVGCEEYVECERALELNSHQVLF